MPPARSPQPVYVHADHLARSREIAVPPAHSAQPDPGHADHLADSREIGVPPARSPQPVYVHADHLARAREIAVPPARAAQPRARRTAITWPARRPQMSCGHTRRGRVRARCRMDTNARRRLAARALGQGGLLTTLDVAELAGGGMNLRREVRAGHWRLVLPGVVVAAGTPVDRELLTRAAVLWLPPYGALSHASAARCWGIHVPNGAGVWVTVPWEAPQRSR